MSDASKIMTATEPADVAQLAIIQALRAISDGQSRLATTMSGIHEEQKRDRVLLQEVRDKVVKIESNQVDRRLGDVEKRVKNLEDAHVEERGFHAALAAVWKNAPTALGYIIAMVAAVVVYLKATGRL